MLQTTIIFEGNIAADLDVAFAPPASSWSGSRCWSTGAAVTPTPTSGRRRTDPACVHRLRHAWRAHRRLPGQGDRVLIVGSIVTDAWSDKATGDKRTTQRVLVDAAGPSLRWATARVHKAQRTSSDTDSDQTD